MFTDGLKEDHETRRLTLHLCFAVIGGLVAVYIAVIAMHMFVKPWLAQNPAALSPGAWIGQVPPDWPLSPDQHYHTSAPLYLLEQDMAQRGDLSYSMSKHHIGWPFPICHNRRRAALLGFTVVESESDWRHGWLWALDRFPGTGVSALRPTWPGFGIAWAFFTGAISALVWGIPAARRALRRRRGLCVHCGYKGAGGAVCPECGKMGAAAGAG